MHEAWIILFAPLAAAGIITLFTQRWKMLSALISCGAIVLGFVLSVKLFLVFSGGGHGEHAPDLAPAPFQWLVIGDALKIEFGATVDRLSILMLLVVTGVGSAIHIYSIGYMKGDAGFSRYFACMSLFTFSMLGIVLSSNFIQIFIFWELVGVSSYLLIGYWFERPSAADAGNKAFLVNRIGDFGFMLGILLLWSFTQTFNFAEIQEKLPTYGIAAGTLTVIAALIFCGAVGKSAQFPLHVWLPDAMEGPTPVSALIHAATMVAAGVYMLCRVSFLLLPSAQALEIIAWIGGITAVMAAVMAIAQNDIKRILAYSTLSQLGYMVMAVGLGGPDQATFHLTTHAFFKALLFLGAGSVIVAMHHEQDIWKMGGLWRKTPITFWTFLIGVLALGGVPPLSGFWSKDGILLLAHEKSMPLFVLGVATAGLTAFYMGRELFVVFCGKPRDHHAYEHAHESPAVMTLPLVFLAILSVIGGFGTKVASALWIPQHAKEGGHDPMLTALLVAVPLVGFVLAAAIYWKAEPSDAPVKNALGGLYTVIENKFYFDEMYAWLVKYVQGTIAKIAEWFDLWILQRLGIGGLSLGTGLLGRTVRLLQTGNIGTYAFLFGLGVTLIIYWVVVR
jgi:NADH-quinone oxidoreductase subunit L